ncbi:glycosyltransferase family 2 protein [Viridothelium virens]|uniref:chitin synthase n=1 Tax=Viridothelium virens TaxID=1048519 RepID=A0A6A6GZ54_VIRVR|nr:glycosyltransferase family 2 protein [Viridothelium virens]
MWMPPIFQSVPAIIARHTTSHWPIKDIVFVAIISTILLAAFLEWFLWLTAFVYCLAKVFQKAENIRTRVMCIVIAILFSCLRAIFLPVMVVTLPLPAEISKYYPPPMVSFLQWFAFWTFAGLLIIPWLCCVYQLVSHNVGRASRIKYVLDESTAPKVVIVMPCYNEIPEVLLRTVDSIVDCDYPPSCLHIFLSFDGDQEDSLYLNTIERLGVPLILKSYPKSIDVAYRRCRITVSRFPHGGKRSCQKKTFKLIDKVYTDYLKRNDNLFILFIDSDCILDKSCIQNFMYEMELKPGNNQNMLAMTGVITSTTEKNSLITLLQDMEYIHGQLFERSVESGCGSITCLPGALTMLRFSAFRKMAKYYFADNVEQCVDLFDYGKCHLGEDRWLTHLFMIGAKQRYQIQMNSGAFCKTEAVQTFKSLLKQRRRWFLGAVTNEACMLTDIRLWWRYPLLLTLRFASDTIRTTSLLFFIMVISIITTSQKVKNLPVGFIAVSLGLNWLLMLYFGAKLGRYKIMLYPLMFVVNPFFNWLYMVYGIFTAGQRTWGGPRADAGAADSKTTPQAAIEHAEATGDDLNVIPETFKPALEERGAHVTHVPVQPWDSVEGRFAAPERHSDGLFELSRVFLHPDTLPNPQAPRRRGRHVPSNLSFESLMTDSSATDSVYVPRRVESFIDTADELQAYHNAQAAQRPAGGAAYENPDAIGLAISSSGKGNEDDGLGGPSGDIADLGYWRSRASSESSIGNVSLHPGFSAMRSPLSRPTFLKTADRDEDRTVTKFRA